MKNGVHGKDHTQTIFCQGKRHTYTYTENSYLTGMEKNISVPTQGIDR